MVFAIVIGITLEAYGFVANTAALSFGEPDFSPGYLVRELCPPYARQFEEHYRITSDTQHVLQYIRPTINECSGFIATRMKCVEISSNCVEIKRKQRIDRAKLVSQSCEFHRY